MAFLSDNHLEPDNAVESFVLRPHSNGSSSNGDANHATEA
jgi:hypothetical protein